jgi:hypothetical protein
VKNIDITKLSLETGWKFLRGYPQLLQINVRTEPYRLIHTHHLRILLMHWGPCYGRGRALARPWKIRAPAVSIQTTSRGHGPTQYRVTKGYNSRAGQNHMGASDRIIFWRSFKRITFKYFLHKLSSSKRRCYSAPHTLASWAAARPARPLIRPFKNPWALPNEGWNFFPPQLLGEILSSSAEPHFLILSTVTFQTHCCQSDAIYWCVRRSLY